MKVTMTDFSISGGKIGIRARGNVDLDASRFKIANCEKACDFSDEATPQRHATGKEENKWHESPAGIVSLNIAAMLAGTAIGRVIGL